MSVYTGDSILTGKIVIIQYKIALVASHLGCFKRCVAPDTTMEDVNLDKAEYSASPNSTWNALQFEFAIDKKFWFKTRPWKQPIDYAS